MKTCSIYNYIDMILLKLIKFVHNLSYLLYCTGTLLYFSEGYTI